MQLGGLPKYIFFFKVTCKKNRLHYVLSSIQFYSFTNTDKIEESVPFFLKLML